MIVLSVPEFLILIKSQEAVTAWKATLLPFKYTHMRWVFPEDMLSCDVIAEGTFHIECV